MAIQTRNDKEQIMNRLSPAALITEVRALERERLSLEQLKLTNNGLNIQDVIECLKLSYQNRKKQIVFTLMKLGPVTIDGKSYKCENNDLIIKSGVRTGISLNVVDGRVVATAA